MNNKPVVCTFNDGSKIWNHTFDTFRVKVYVPSNTLSGSVINYGFDAPYLLIFENTELSNDEAKRYADEKGLLKIAAANDSSVVFVYPTCDGAWKNADITLWQELISNTKIHEFYEDGYAILNNRFTNTCDGYAIRGAIYRAYVFGSQSSADYIATHLLKTIEGDGLWGKADIIAAGCILENLSITPDIQRSDMPIVSISNSDTINTFISSKTSYFYIADDNNYSYLYNEFLSKYQRWGWHGELKNVPRMNELGMIEEPCVVTLTTSKDNCGIDKGSLKHKVGYIAYYNKDLFDKGSAPLVLCFHGGGDSAKYIAKVAEWYRVAMNHNFLLVCVENHLNSTATEMIELIGLLRSKYSIDESRIYATGFSMGGCKSWDLYQEYPEYFAGLAPMDATFDVGYNIYNQKAPVPINQDILVPIFYAGGEITPLPELPFQEQRCIDRMAYVLKVNRATKEYNVSLNNHDNWDNRIWGINGDMTKSYHDDDKDGTLTLQFFTSNDGICYSVFGSISNQGHECRYHTCEHAWLFLSQFRRTSQGIELNK